MADGRAQPVERKLVLLVLLALLLSALFLIGIFDMPRERFVSHEVTFTDSSASGLAIMPASCASSPYYYHGNLTSVEGGPWPLAQKSLLSVTGTTEYGWTAVEGGAGTQAVVCVTNTSGADYFIPTNTAAELQSFINLGTSNPNLQVWGIVF